MNAVSILRRLMVYSFSSRLPLYIVTEYPKSGGTWFAHMIAEYLGLSFPRNEMPKLKSSIIHGHYLYFLTMKNVFVIFRDGRDIMVSFYFHSFFENELHNQSLVKRMRKELPFSDFEDVEANLPKFIEHKFSRKRPPRFTWSEFVDSWIDKDVVFVRYENLLHNTANEVGRALEELSGQKSDYGLIRQIAEKYSFKKQARRNPGEENRSSFLRKGIIGDWKHNFNRDSREVFEYFAGDQLIKLGYEKDRSWV